MYRTKRRIAGAFAVTFMVFALAGCEKDSNENVKTSKPVSEITAEVIDCGIEFPEMVTRDTIKISLIPIFYGLNWFVSRYILFTLFIPFINSFLTSLSKYRYLSFLLILFGSSRKFGG